MKVRNTFIIFIVSGFWHGANWTFIVWGALNAIYFLPLLLTKRNRQNMEVVAQNTYLPTIKEFFQMGVTFGLTVIAWVFFRAENIGQAINYLGEIFSFSLFSFPEFEGRTGALITLFLLLFFIHIEWKGRENQYAIEQLGFNYYRIFRWSLYLLIGFLIFLFKGSEQEFIYFQF